MPIASRLTNTGTLLVNGSFDENTSIAPSKFRTTSTTVYAGELDEVTISGGAVAKREINTGVLQVKNIFDEFTGAPIVDTSLQLWLDAGQPASYPGTGTTWTDLSGNGNNGTLINGVGFDGSNGGGLVFDGSNDYVDLNTNNIITGTNPFTFSCFYTITAFNGGGEIFGNYGTGYTTNYLWISGEYGAYLDGAVYFPGAPLSAGTYHMAVTRDSGGAVILYKNGVQVNSGTLANSIAVGQNFRLGADVNIPGERLNGKIYNQMVYNRALTAAEIVQNYNALQSRYGLASITATQMPVVQRQQSSGTLLVNGEFDEFTGAPVVDGSLLLWLDAAQTTSYPGTGTTWTDLSGKGNNGTLTSGPTFSSADGGSIVFDGTDDYVITGFIDIISGNNITVEVWVNCGSSQNQYANILDFNHSNLGFVIQQDSTTLNTFYFAYHNGIGYEVTPTITLPTNTWCQLVFVKSGTSTIGYLNSVNTISYTGSANIASTVLNLALGRWLGGGGRVFNGKISNTKLYNRALTADEITTNFNALRNRYGI